MQYDLIIIGDGSVGVATGYCAHRAGLNALMADAYQPLHQESDYYGSSRLIRHACDEGGEYAPLVLRAQQLWDELTETSGEAVFERAGVINLGSVNSPLPTNVAASARTFDLEVKGLDTQAVIQYWPGIRLPGDYRAIFEPASDVLHSELAAETWIRLAREAGYVQLFNCPVSAIHHHADGVTIDTLDSEYHGKKLLISTGTWTAHLPPDLPIQPICKASTWFQADGRYDSKNHLPVFTGELPNDDQYYGFPTKDSELKVGKYNDGQPASTPQKRSTFGAVANDSSESFPFLRNVLPGIGGCLHGAFCTYDDTVDEDSIINTPPGRLDTLLITDLSSHGFKFAPVPEGIASQFARGQTSTSNLTSFSPVHFGL